MPDRDPVLAVEHAGAQAVEVGSAGVVERDDLPVELHVHGQPGELGQERGHIPAAAAPLETRAAEATRVWL